MGSGLEVAVEEGTGLAVGGTGVAEACMAVSCVAGGVSVAGDDAAAPPQADSANAMTAVKNCVLQAIFMSTSNAQGVKQGRDPCPA